MHINNKALGEEYSKKFSIGDLVSWVELYYHEYESGEKKREVFSGIILAITNKAQGGRAVCYARVMPNTKDTIMEIAILRIKKFGTI
jgi:hypothetical protein